MNTGRYRSVAFIKSLVIVFIGLMCPYIAFSQSSMPASVRVKNTMVTVAANAGSWLQQMQQKYVHGTSIQVLVHFNHMPGAADRAALKEQGIIIEDFIDGKSFTAVINYTPLLKHLPAIIYGVSDVDPSWKIDERILKLKRNANATVNVLVTFYDVVPDSNIRLLVRSLGGVIEQNDAEELHIYKISLPLNNIMLLAAYFGVQYISVYNTPVPLNFESRTASKANLASLATIYGGYGLDGTGVTVGVGDNTSGNFHIDLKDRIINYNPSAYTDHGVHINGIVGGAGIMDPKGEGVAPGARMVDHLFDGIWLRTGTFSSMYNMNVTNNSYAAVIRDCSYSGTYDALSIAIDKMALQYKNVLHVFAAGNDGDINCAPYPDGFATVSGGYQPAKNNIVVTSTDKFYVNAPSGSRGPVKDGRLKPEITAVGVDVNSTTHTEEYLVAGGTSMACPGVSGGLVLLTQRYKQLNANAIPRSDVLKALVLNGATDIGNPGPDYRFGFGFMNVYRSLQMLDNLWYKTSTITNGDQQSFNVTVPPNTAKLKVMLCYHDDPGTPLAPKALVNDLDIEVAEPSSVVHKPLVLDPASANILNNAVEKEDRLNNSEQVTINNPAAGTYAVTVKGFSVPSATQDYVVSYDFVPATITLTYPTTGAAVKAADSLRIYWDANDGDANGTFKIEYSTDGGGVWSTVANNVPASDRQYRWLVPPTISSGKCKMRITRNTIANQSTTGLFAINPQPNVSLDAVQCPGYIRINWAGIAGASGYEVMMKRGPKMQVMATIATPTYTFSGLALDSTYYLAVRPVIDGLSGYRSLAIKRMPNDGNCSGSISDGDMMIQKVLKPNSGRKFTSTELKTNDTLSLLVRNLDDVKVDSFRVSYSINAGPWQSQVFTSGVAANNTAVATITGLNLSAFGNYKIDVAIQNLSLSDPVNGNDSTSKTVKQLHNDPISLTGGFLNNFEDWPVVETIRDSIGISPDERWDYTNESDTCRLRSFITQAIVIGGSRSISLDAIYNSNSSHGNEFAGTFNMSNYNTANDEVRMEFDYILHSRNSAVENSPVLVRGTDSKSWLPLFELNSDAGGTGSAYNSGSLSVTDALQKGSQLFSTSTQINFTENDKSLISERNLGSGVTIDNVKLYTVQNDIQLKEIRSPAILECGLTGKVPLVITVRNGVNQELNNVQLYYRFDGGAVVNETLASIKGKEQLIYAFDTKLDVTQKGKHTLSVWVAATGDTYVANDSILNYTFHNQPLISTYPYLENFEAGDGGWYTEGTSDSWAYGTPASPKINKAASGTKAWKTNLTGNYNPSELSYLYSPCFDVSGLTYPKYRFKLAFDIENCGPIICDAAGMQYSTDGIEWQRLNDSSQSSNWYTDTTYNIWTGENTTWHMAAVKLPKGMQTVRFRYLFAADNGTEKEGIAVDDVEVIDDIPYPAVDNLIGVDPNPTTDGNINITWTAKGGSEIGIVIFNSVGKELYKHTAISNEGYNTLALTTPHFSSGVYMVRIIIGDKKYTRKVVYL